MFPKYFIIGAFNAALAIALGAFGAHGLEEKISEHYLEVFETGVRYHMYSALGLMLISLMDKMVNGSPRAQIGGKLILAGTIIFSGSLYVLSLTGYSKLGMITPIGGLCMLIGWGFVIAGAIKNRTK
ncbi:DUF423 domain-containing protein [Paenibacillus sp. GSMTC-2017]|uniref:DUF423 domain-containing protein n=1 Tax=Paenibacillus sp. GSMTC-2017 TaxID=2794350 RepID=UPI0018D9DDF0|nr:DUF423 domain-containing protein [Paenibacillus sp. GSMTC-2017]MBH5318545.1 DUF423 domain-containing protein [Paenibacillus sp. GSMTC-2017]